MAFGGFEVGQVYNRQKDIHGRFKGQERGGIATPAYHPIVIAFTGETGTAHGYEDGWTPEGVYRYFGEGQHGNMVWKAGNVAIRDHTAAGKDLLLFQILGKGQARFLGEFFYAGYEIELAPDTDGALRQAFVFNLVPLESLSEASAPEQQGDFQDDLPPKELKGLRSQALSAAADQTSPQSRSEARQKCYQRSVIVRDYVLARAKGHCEACGTPAPFKTTRGRPYLEPHHIRRLSDGGPDDPRFMGAVCPNCHREIHYGVEGDAQCEPAGSGK
jgi:5-methylcytosine-specific restriction protein A